MSQHKKDKRDIKSNVPEIIEFVNCLNGVIDERTSHNRLIKALGVGNGKLTPYLSGEQVPHWRVVEHYILRPLAERFSPPVRGEEIETLRRLHRAAGAVQVPRPPTRADQIAFLEQDLAEAWAKRDEVQRQLDDAVRQSAADQEHAGQLTATVTRLRQQVEDLTKEHVRLAAELASVKQEFGEVSNAKGRLIAEGQQKIADLEWALRDQLRTLDQLQHAVGQHQQHVRLLRDHGLFLQGKITQLEAVNADQRLLFMRLIAHQHNRPLEQILRRETDEMQHRLARSEETINRLSQTNQHLSAELDRATSELAFLRAGMMTPFPGPPLMPFQDAKVVPNYIEHLGRPDIAGGA